jgi:hypothetical protein
MLTLTSFQKLYQESTSMFLFAYEDVHCSRLTTYSAHKKLIDMVIKADDIVKFHIIIEMTHQNEIIEWCFGTETDPVDAVYFKDQLNKYKSVELNEVH